MRRGVFEPGSRSSPARRRRRKRPPAVPAPERHPQGPDSGVCSSTSLPHPPELRRGSNHDQSIGVAGRQALRLAGSSPAATDATQHVLHHMGGATFIHRRMNMILSCSLRRSISSESSTRDRRRNQGWLTGLALRSWTSSRTCSARPAAIARCRPRWAAGDACQATCWVADPLRIVHSVAVASS